MVAHLDLDREIEVSIARGELELALNQIIELSIRIVAEPRIVGSVFGSRKLDSLCQTIGAKTLASLVEPVARDSQPLEPRKQVAIVATETYNQGGHTAVIKDLISAYSAEQSVLIITDTFYNANHVLTRSVFPGVEVLFAPQYIGPLERLLWLQKQIIQLQPHRTFLLNHMEDAVAVAALQPTLPTQTVYFHHSDHRFALGVFLPHAKHLDFRPAGLENCRYQLGIENNILTPLIHPDVTQGRARTSFLTSRSLRTCTSSSHKFDAPYAFSLIHEVLPGILEATGGSHVHIGSLSEKDHKIIAQELKERKIPQDRFIHVTWVKSLWRALSEWEVDVYLDSFPVGGCRSVIEALGAGIPMIVHHNYKSRLLSNLDLVYPEAFCWQNPTELYDCLAKLSATELEKQSLLARQHYQENYTEAVFRNSLTLLEKPTAAMVARLPNYVMTEYTEFLEYARKPTSQPQRQLAGASALSHTTKDWDKFLEVITRALTAMPRGTINNTQLSELLFVLHAQLSLDNHHIVVSSPGHQSVLAEKFAQSLTQPSSKVASQETLSTLLFDLCTRVI